jgi:hypothetical protein
VEEYHYFLAKGLVNDHTLHDIIEHLCSRPALDTDIRHVIPQSNVCVILMTNSDRESSGWRLNAAILSPTSRESSSAYTVKVS